MKTPTIKNPEKSDYRLCMKHDQRMYKKMSQRTGFEYYAHYALNERGQRYVCFGKSKY